MQMELMYIYLISFFNFTYYSLYLFKVLYVDFGNTLKIDFNALFELSNDLAQQPFLVGIYSLKMKHKIFNFYIYLSRSNVNYLILNP